MPLSTLVPRKQTLLAFQQAHAFARVRRFDFFDRHRFPRQRGLNDEQIFGGNQPHIGGNHVAGGQLYDVAGNKLADRYFLFLSVADHRSRDADHCFQFGRRGVGASFLNKAKRQSKNNHQEHDRAGAEIASGIGNGREHRQQNHQRIAGRGK